MQPLTGYLGAEENRGETGEERSTMHMSIRTYRVGSGSIDDLMHRVDRDFAEAMAQEPGFIAYQAVDCGDNEVMSITLFRDEAGAAESIELAAEWVKDNLGEFELERTEMIGGEAMVSRAASEVLEPAHH